MQPLPGATIPYPSNWDAMQAQSKVDWVKGLGKNPKAIAENNAWLKQMSSKYGHQPMAHKDAVQAVGNKFQGKANQIFKPSSAAAKSGAGAGAAKAGGLLSLLKAPMSAGLSFGAPIAAGVLGALAIFRAKKKFDKEIESVHSPERNKRHRDLLKMIKRSGQKKRLLTDEQIKKIKESDIPEAEKNAKFEQDMRLRGELGLPR